MSQVAKLKKMHKPHITKFSKQQQSLFSDEENQTEYSNKDHMNPQEKLECSECQFIAIDGEVLEDAYDSYYESIVYYALHNQWKNQIYEINDELRRHQLCRSLKQKFKKLKLTICSRNNYHLINKKSSKIVPMVRKTLKLLQQLHGIQHLDGQAMHRKAREWKNYDPSFVERYIFKFISNCAECKKILVLPTPKHQCHLEDIYQSLKYIEHNKFDLSKKQQAVSGKNESLLEKLRLNLTHCIFECQNDEYSEYYSSLLYYLKSKTYPPEIQNLPEQEKAIRKKEIGSTTFYYKISVCSHGTNHLWKLRMKNRGCKQNSNKKIYLTHMRIPMQQEMIFLSQMAHGEDHNSMRTMQVLLKNAHYFYNSFRDFIQSGSGFCDNPDCKESGKGNPVVKMAEIYTKSCKKYKGKQILVEMGKKINNRSQLKLENQSTNTQLKQLTQPQPCHVASSLLSSEIAIRREQALKQLLFLQGCSQIQIFCSQDSKHSYDAILITSKQMIYNYLCHGQCVNVSQFIDILWTEQQWGVYVFWGCDGYGCAKVFGVGVVSDKSFQNFYFLFDLFHQHVCKGLYPQTYCTIFNAHIKSALQSIAFHHKNPEIRKITHIFNKQSTLDYFLQSNKTNKNLNEMQKKLRRIMEIKSVSVFVRDIKVLREILPAGKCKEFIQSKHLYCMSYMKERFNGYGQEIELIKFIDRAVREIIGCHSSLAKLGEQFLLFNSLSKSYQPYISQSSQNLTCSLPKNLSLMYSPWILQKLFNNFADMCPLKLTSYEYYFQEDQCKCTYMVTTSNWQCSCSEIYLYGIPCQHLVWVIREGRGSLQKYISERWRID